MHIIFGGGTQQWYHGDLKGRACALVACLTGNVGQLGGGISTYVGQYKTRFNTGSWMVASRRHKELVPVPLLGERSHPADDGQVPQGRLQGAWWWDGATRSSSTTWPSWLRHALEERRAGVPREHGLPEHADGGSSADRGLPLRQLVREDRAHHYAAAPVRAAPAAYRRAARRGARGDLGLDRACEPHRSLEGRSLWPRFTPEDSEKRSDEVLALLAREGRPHHRPPHTRRSCARVPASWPTRTLARRRSHSGSRCTIASPFPTVSRPNPIDATAKFVRSGRIEFYRDEDIFLELDEQLPCYKPPFEDTEYKDDPEARELYPLGYTTRNSAFRVHATYVNNPFMLELQDNTPKVWLNPETAADRGLKNGRLGRGLQQPRNGGGPARRGPGRVSNAVHLRPGLVVALTTTGRATTRSSGPGSTRPTRCTTW